MLIVVTYLWGNKYGAEDVRKLAAGLRRHMQEPYTFVLVSDDLVRRGFDHQLPDGCNAVWSIPEQDRPLTEIPGCFARLRLFDPDWQQAHDIVDGDRIVSMDLDNVITGDLYPPFHRPEPFLILKGANAVNPCPYNGSVWMLRAGYRPDVWADFSIEAASKVPFYAPAYPDDQSWFHHKMPNAAGWNVGPQSGIYGFQKPGWPGGDDLPKDARLVAFFGWRSPEKFKHLNWVQEHWRS